MAHPGLRDSAVVKRKKPSIRDSDENIAKRPYVHLCPYCDGWTNSCQLGKNCSDYHLYIRPTTAEIILMIYPIENGIKSKLLPGGAVYKGAYVAQLLKRSLFMKIKFYYCIFILTFFFVGNVLHDKFNGYGSCTWKDGSTYVGDWEDNSKHGKGILRKADGSEFVGIFKHGKVSKNAINFMRSKCYLLQKHGFGVQTTINGEEYVGL